LVAKKNRPPVPEGRNDIKNKQDYIGRAYIVLSLYKRR
jgi:hypothetical protein